jgi:hypothetical protein
MRRLPILVLLAPGCAGEGGDPADPAPDAAAPAPDGGGEAPPPTWASEMIAADDGLFTSRMQSGGAVELGVASADADDGGVARLVLAGAPRLGTGDHVGPAFASELATTNADFHFGTYRTRVRLASCAPGEEAVNGLFTYFNDGSDHDGDGLVDNAEIDFEILCGTPDVVFLTVWTEYSGDDFRKWTRAIDLATGAIWASPSDHEYGLVAAGQDPALVLPDLLDPGGFVELGFDWRADRVRFFAVVAGADRTLAELTDAAGIPTLPGRLMFNVWHPLEHWFGGGGAPDFPAGDATLLVDWARYWRR